MLPTLLENNRRLSHHLSIVHRTATVRVLLGHVVVDATVALLEPSDSRAHNRVVSTVCDGPFSVCY
jgi:hypothetical protein